MPGTVERSKHRRRTAAFLVRRERLSLAWDDFALRTRDILMETLPISGKGLGELWGLTYGVWGMVDWGAVDVDLLQKTI